MSLENRARILIDTCRGKGLKIATAESCTGGLLAALLTEITGSSDVFERGFVTYSNEAKIELLGVDPDLIATFGAVSRETAAAMAEGALNRSHAHLAISITGIAGPDGGSAGKPVGLVHFGLCRKNGEPEALMRTFGERLSRGEIRRQAVAQALTLLEQCG